MLMISLNIVIFSDLTIKLNRMNIIKELDKLIEAHYSEEIDSRDEWLREIIYLKDRLAKNNEVLDLVSKRLLADTDVEYDHPTGLIKGKLMYDDDEFTTLILKHEGGIINLPDLDKCIVC